MDSHAATYTSAHFNSKYDINRRKKHHYNCWTLGVYHNSYVYANLRLLQRKKSYYNFTCCLISKVLHLSI